MPEFIFAPDAVPPFPIFTQAVVSRGTIYLAGSIGCDKNYKLAGDIKAQTRASLENIATILKAAGSDMKHIVKATIYVTNLDNVAASNEVYSEFFEAGKMPPRTCVPVPVLPLGAEFEMECIAEIPESTVRSRL